MSLGGGTQIDDWTGGSDQGNPDNGSDPGTNPDPIIIDPIDPGDDPPDDPGSGDPVIGGGDAPTEFDYDVVSVKTAVGSSYIASQNGSMTVSNSVSCLSRVNGFLATNTSSMKIDACAASATNYGMSVSASSSQRIANSTSAVCTTAYFLDGSSVQFVHYSAAIFAIRQAVYARGTSTFKPVEFEIMTKYYNPFVVNVTPTLFQSGGNAYVQNNSLALSSAATRAGFSGDYISVNPITFIWVDFKGTNPGLGDLDDVDPNDSEGNNVSYRYVPLQHSLDYDNVVNANGTPNGTDFGDLVPLIAHRSNYFSVKPPSGLVKPEDGSGNPGLNSSLTSPYTLTNVIYGSAF